jgi:hypothetical protein
MSDPLSLVSDELWLQREDTKLPSFIVQEKVTNCIEDFKRKIEANRLF